MNRLTTGRRDFIGKISVLSSCLLAGSPSSLFAKPNHTSFDLTLLWNSFVELHGGKEIISDRSIDAALLENKCAGQFYQAGNIVVFDNSNILAQPTWIYWQAQTSAPNDVVVSLFNNGEKICRLNVFELETIVQLSKDEKQELHELMLLIREDRTKENPKSSRIITTIERNKLAKSSIAAKDFKIDSSIFKNV